MAKRDDKNAEGKQSQQEIALMNNNNGRIVDEENVVFNIMSLINRMSNALQTQITDTTGRQVLADGFGNLRTSKKISQFSAQFGYGIPDNEVIIATTGTGQVVADDAMLKVRTLNGVGTASAETIQSVRYIPGTMAYMQFTVAGIPVGTNHVGDTVWIGNFDAEDGFGGGSKDGEIYIFRRRYNGVNPVIMDLIPQSEWNLDKMDGTGPSGFVYNPSAGNIFEISWIFLGFGPILFSLKMPDDSWIGIHRIEYPNTTNRTHISLPYLPARVEITNTSGRSIELVIGSIDAGIYDGGTAEVDSSRRPRGFNLANVVGALPKSVNGVGYLVAFRSAQTISGRRNKISSLLNMVAASTNGTQALVIELIFNPTVTTPGTWVRADGLSAATSETPVEYSINTVFNLATGKSSALIFNLARVGVLEPFFVDQINSLLRRGDTAVFKISSSNGTVDQFGIGYYDLY